MWARTYSFDYRNPAVSGICEEQVPARKSMQGPGARMKRQGSTPRNQLFVMQPFTHPTPRVAGYPSFQFRE